MRSWSCGCWQAKSLLLVLLPDYLIHATLVQVCHRGLLISGPSGIGKSQLALDLVSRGHALVVDDSPLLQRRGSQVYGRCRANFAGLLHLPQQGLVDVRAQFGSQAALAEIRVELLACLVRQLPKEVPCYRFVEGIPMPCAYFPVNPETVDAVEAWVKGSALGD